MIVVVFRKKTERGRKDLALVLYSQSQRGEHEKQIVFVTLYTSYLPLFKVLHPAFRFVNAIQKVRRPTFYVVQVPRGRRDITL